jgi:alkanesulfonate monooxygenase SsuD/methylene tetrahydromethanopterin reductase-like flavin-dependent oxidoreductase (luciferase family)
VLIGGSSAPALARAARLAEGWCGPPCTFEDNVAHRAVLERELRAAGRDPGSFSLWVRSNEPTTPSLIARYGEAGFKHLIVALPLNIDSPAGRLEWLEQAAAWYGGAGC